LLIAGCGGSSNGGNNSGGGGNGGGGSTSPTTVTFTVSGPAPTAVATRIGSGSFTAASLSGGKVTLSIPSGTTTFAVAYLCPADLTPSGGNVLIEYDRELIFEGSTADGTSFTGYCSQSAASQSGGTTGTLTGSIDASAIPNANSVNIFVQNGTQVQLGSQSTLVGSFSDTQAPAGNDRVLVVVDSWELVNGNQQVVTAGAVRNFASVAVPGDLNHGDQVVLTAADQTTMQPITYSGTPAGFTAPSSIVAYYLALQTGFVMSTMATDSYPVMPAGVYQSGDFYLVEAQTMNPANPYQVSRVDTFTPTGGPISVSFPTAWNYAGPSPAALPAFQMSYTGFNGAANVLEGAAISWNTDTYVFHSIQVSATTNFMGSSATLAIPNLSGVTGFLAAPASGAGVTWTAQFTKSTFPQTSGNWATAGVSSSAVSGGSYVVP
jgi:hypothetical protein